MVIFLKKFYSNGMLFAKPKANCKLVASLQLECWNIGIVGSGIIQLWVNGKTCVEDKIKNG